MNTFWAHTERTVDERLTLCERWPQSELRVQKSMWTMNAQWANSERTVGKHKNGTVFNNNKVYNNVSGTIVTTLELKITHSEKKFKKQKFKKTKNLKLMQRECGIYGQRLCE